MKSNIDLTENNAFSRVQSNVGSSIETHLRNVLIESAQPISKIAAWNRLTTLTNYDDYWKHRREIIGVEDDGTNIKLGDHCYRCGIKMPSKKIWDLYGDSELCPKCDSELEIECSNYKGIWTNHLNHKKALSFSGKHKYTDFQYLWFKN